MRCTSYAQRVTLLFFSSNAKSFSSGDAVGTAARNAFTSSRTASHVDALAPLAAAVAAVFLSTSIASWSVPFGDAPLAGATDTAAGAGVAITVAAVVVVVVVVVVVALVGLALLKKKNEDGDDGDFSIVPCRVGGKRKRKSTQKKVSTPTKQNRNIKGPPPATPLPPLCDARGQKREVILLQTTTGKCVDPFFLF